MNLRTFARRYAWPNWPWYLGGLIALGITNAINLWIPQLVKHVVNTLSTGETGSDLVPWTILALGAFLIAIRTLSRVLIFWPGRTIERNTKSDAFRHFMELPQLFYFRHGMGDLIARITHDVGHLRVFCSFGALQAANLALLTIMTVTTMLATAPDLTIIALVPLVFMVVITRVGMPRLHAFFRENQESLGRLSTRVTEAFTRVHNIQLAGAEGPFSARIAVENEVLFRSNMRVVWMRNLLFPLTSLLTGLSQVAIVGYGGTRVLQGAMTVGDILAFSVYIATLSFPLAALGMILALLERARTSLARLSEVLESPEEQAIAADARAPAEYTQANANLLTIHDLSFAYESGSQSTSRSFSLQGVNIVIRAGEKVGIWGPIGSGKSTLCQLVSRIMDPPVGTIFFRGHDVRTMDPHLLRRDLGYALQESHLFSASILENLTLGIEDRQADSSTIQAVLREVTLDTDFSTFPGGLQTEIGERGIRLSGGQKQRLALARILLRPFDLLLLDDVLSAVDEDTEASLLASLSHRKTAMLIISHRRVAMSHCDRVYRLEEGQIVASGTFEQVLHHRLVS